MTDELQKRKSRDVKGSDPDRSTDERSRGFFEAFGVRPWGAFWTVDAAAPVLRAARTDVTDTGTAYRIVAEVPGIPKDALEIHIKGASVEIRGENTAEKTQKDGEAYVHRERTHVGYYRALELPEPVIAADAKAKVVNGVLELELPKQNPTPVETDVKVRVQ